MTALPSVASIGIARAGYELKLFFRRKEAVFFTFLFPVMFLVLFGLVFGNGRVDGTSIRYSQVLVSGIMASGLMSVTFVNLAIGITNERDEGSLKRLAGTPMPKAAYFIGKIGMVLVCVVAELALLLVVGVVFFGLDLPTDVSRWVTFAWVLVLGTARVHAARHRRLQRAPVGEERGGRDQPPVRGAAVHLGCVRAVLRAVPDRSDHRQRVPAEVDRPGLPIGVPPVGLPADRARWFLAAWADGARADRLVGPRRDPLHAYLPVERRPIRMSAADAIVDGQPGAGGQRVGGRAALEVPVRRQRFGGDDLRARVRYVVDPQGPRRGDDRGRDRVVRALREREP